MWVWKKQEFRKTSKRLDTRKRAKTHKNGVLVLGIILLHLQILGEEQRENARFCPDPAGFVRTSYDKLHGWNKSSVSPKAAQSGQIRCVKAFERMFHSKNRQSSLHHLHLKHLKPWRTWRSWLQIATVIRKKFMFVVLSLSLSLSLAHSLVMPEIEQNGWPPNYNKSSAYLHCLVALFSVMYWSSIYCSFLMLFEVSAPMHFQVSHITCPNQGADWVRVPQYEQNRSALPMPLQLLHSWLPHPQSAWFVHQMASILGRHYAMKQLWNHAKFEAALLVPYGTLAYLAWCDVTTHSCYSFRFV